MNHLSSIAKNLRELEESYGKIVKAETRGRADAAIREVMGRVFPVVVGETAAFTGTFSGGATVTLGAEQNAPASISVGVADGCAPGVTVTSQGGVTTVYPAGYKPFVDAGERGPGVCEPEVEGDVGGTGTFYPETVELEETIGGWPVKGEIAISGLAPNRRSLKGSLGDGRVVCVERTFGREWKVGEKVQCRLIRAGAAPLFRVMPR